MVDKGPEIMIVTYIWHKGHEIMIVTYIWHKGPEIVIVTYIWHKRSWYRDCDLNMAQLGILYILKIVLLPETDKRQVYYMLICG